MLPQQAKVDLDVMAMKWYSQIFKAGASTSDYLISYPENLLVGVLTLSRDAVSVFYEWASDFDSLGGSKLTLTHLNIKICLCFRRISVTLFLLHLEAVFTTARFYLTANVSHETLHLVLCFVGMYFAAASRWTWTKFSYSSFGVRVSVFSGSASNLFLNAITYLYLISLLLRRA